MVRKGFTLISKACDLKVLSLLRFRWRSCKGFTLIELMVTITIIAILMSIAVTAYMSFQKNARDARRKSDLATIQSALEQYHADQLNYPISDDIVTGFSLMSPDGIRNYLNKIPGDPNGSPQYSYYPMTSGGSLCTNSSSICTKYCLYAQVEESSNSNVIEACPTPALIPDPLYEVTSP